MRRVKMCITRARVSVSPYFPLSAAAVAAAARFSIRRRRALFLCRALFALIDVLVRTLALGAGIRGEALAHSV